MLIYFLKVKYNFRFYNKINDIFTTPHLLICLCKILLRYSLYADKRDGILTRRPFSEDHQIVERYSMFSIQSVS